MIIGIHDDEIYARCFEEWLLDRSLELKTDDDTRCAITAYVHHIQRMLVDFYDVDQPEWGEE